MPRGDGTGPKGQGPKTGRGMKGRDVNAGSGKGAERGKGTGGDRIGRMGGTKVGAGPGGQCVCPSCGAIAAHKVGVPCYQIKCPKCGNAMARK